MKIDKTQKVTGKGTGISDEILAEVPDGSFVMPADSTDMLEEGALENLSSKDGAGYGFGFGAKGSDSPKKSTPPADVPVALSNGEFVYTPDDVYQVGLNAIKGTGLKLPDAEIRKIGENVLSKILEDTHTPAEWQKPGHPGMRSFPGGGGHRGKGNHGQGTETPNKKGGALAILIGEVGEPESAEEEEGFHGNTPGKADGGKIKHPVSLRDKKPAGFGFADGGNIKKKGARKCMADGGVTDDDKNKIMAAAESAPAANLPIESVAAVTRETTKDGRKINSYTSLNQSEPGTTGQDKGATPPSASPQFGFSAKDDAKQTTTKPLSYGETLAKAYRDEKNALARSEVDSLQRPATASAYISNDSPVMRNINSALMDIKTARTKRELDAGNKKLSIWEGQLRNENAAELKNADVVNDFYDKKRNLGFNSRKHAGDLAKQAADVQNAQVAQEIAQGDARIKNEQWENDKERKKRIAAIREELKNTTRDSKEYLSLFDQLNSEIAEGSKYGRAYTPAATATAETSYFDSHGNEVKEKRNMY